MVPSYDNIYALRLSVSCICGSLRYRTTNQQNPAINRIPGSLSVDPCIMMYGRRLAARLNVRCYCKGNEWVWCKYLQEVGRVLPCWEGCLPYWESWLAELVT